MKLVSLIYQSIHQFFSNREVRTEVMRIAKSASGSTTVTSSQISDASTIGKEILTATDADAVKADLGITGVEYTQAEKDKLAGIQDGATANQTDAYLLDRANHTGTQAISTITDLQTTLDSKLTGVQGTAVADASTGTEVATINALLASLRTAGIIAS